MSTHVMRKGLHHQRFYYSFIVPYMYDMILVPIDEYLCLTLQIGLGRAFFFPSVSDCLNVCGLFLRPVAFHLNCGRMFLCSTLPFKGKICDFNIKQ